MVSKFLTMTFIWLLLKAIGFLVTAIILWYLTSPVFGAKASKAELQKYADSEQLKSNAEKDTIQVIIPEIGQPTRLDSFTVTTLDPWWTRIQELK